MDKEQDMVIFTGSLSAEL